MEFSDDMQTPMHARNAWTLQPFRLGLPAGVLWRLRKRNYQLHPTSPCTQEFCVETQTRLTEFGPRDHVSLLSSLAR